MNPSASPNPRFRAWLMEHAPRQAPPDLLERTLRAMEALPPSSPRFARWRILASAGPMTAAAVVVAAVGAGLLLATLPPIRPVPDLASPGASAPPLEPTSAASPASTPIPTVATPTVPPTPAAATPPSTPPPVVNWTRTDMPTAGTLWGGATPVGAARIGERLVAVGTLPGVLGSDGSRNAAVWVSDDEGATWHLVDADGFDGLRAVESIAGDGLQAVVAGFADTGGSRPLAGAWYTTDGVTWTTTEGPKPLVVQAGPLGFVGLTSDGAHILHSPDGVSWTQVRDSRDADFRAVAVDGSGRAVAIGNRTSDDRRDGSPTTDVVMSLSEDGEAWSDAQVLVRDGYVTDAVADSLGVVMIGGEAEWFQDGTVLDHQRVWRLTDTGVRRLPLPVADDDYLTGVFSVGDALIVTGDSITTGATDAAVWLSTDGGETWTRVADGPAFGGANNEIIEILETDTGLVAIGRRLDPFDGHLVPVAWTANR